MIKSIWAGMVLACAASAAFAQIERPEMTRESPFASEIYAFSIEDELIAPPACSTLFVGSSSIRFWVRLEKDFPDLTVVRRGFGGAQIENINDYFYYVVLPHKPKEIILYGGENDLSAGKTPQMVLDDLKTFMAMKTQAHGPTPVYFISIKPSKLRAGEFEKQSEANAIVKALADERDDLFYIDVVTPMMADGAVKEIFLSDDLHMTLEGYALWTDAVGEALANANPTPSPYCD